MVDIDIEWKDVEKKVEEEEFKKEKKAEYEQQQEQKQQEQQEEQEEKEEPQQTGSIGLASLISGTWNAIAVNKGYEAVTPQQEEYLSLHTQKIEDKYLKDKINILPEIDFLLSHAIVYIPKYLKHKKEVVTKKSE